MVGISLFYDLYILIRRVRPFSFVRFSRHRSRIYMYIYSCSDVHCSGTLAKRRTSLRNMDMSSKSLYFTIFAYNAYILYTIYIVWIQKTLVKWSMKIYSIICYKLQLISTGCLIKNAGLDCLIFFFFFVFWTLVNTRFLLEKYM